MKTAGDILIVDDESDIRLLIGATLRDEGFTTMEAASAMEARDLLAAKPPGLAILDIWMRDSDMDGLELLEWVKSVYPEVPVLMISGHGTVETAVQAIRNGAYDFIEKPFKEDRLLLWYSAPLRQAALNARMPSFARGSARRAIRTSLASRLRSKPSAQQWNGSRQQPAGS